MFKKTTFKIYSVLFLVLFTSLSYFPTQASFLDDLNEFNYSEVINRDNWWWTETLVLLDDSDISIGSCSIAVDSSNNVFICWPEAGGQLEGGADTDIYLMIWEDSTQTWSDRILISAMSGGISSSQKIVVDNDDNVHIVWVEYSDLTGTSGTDTDIYYKKRSAAGRLTSAEVVSISSKGFSGPADLAVDVDNNVHVVWMDSHNYDGIDFDIIYNVRDVNTDTWSSETVISSESTDHVLDPHVSATNDGAVHVVWSDTTSNMYSSGDDTDIFYKKWDPINLWSSGLVMSYGSDVASTRSEIDTGDDGSVYIVFLDSTDILGAGTDEDVFIRKWDCTTKMWSDLALVSTNKDGDAKETSVFVDKDNVVHIGWYDYSFVLGGCSGGNAFYKSLDQNSQEFSSEVVLSSSSTGIYADLPLLCVDSYGYVHAIWIDDSDINGAGIDKDPFYKKLVGPPAAPILKEFPSAIDRGGNISVEWTNSLSAVEYKVYRSNTEILDVSTMSPIAVVDNYTFSDNIDETGVYYYAIVAGSYYGDSTLSNSVSVEIVEEVSTGIFSTINWGEIIIIGGGLFVLQAVFVVIALVLIGSRTASPSNKKKPSSKKGKKK